jgi:hypothetical protein
VSFEEKKNNKNPNHHFYIKFIKAANNKDLEINKIHKKIAGNNIDNNFNNEIDDTKKSNEEFLTENGNIFTENILIFANEIEDLVFKWIAVLNYLIKKEY